MATTESPFKAGLLKGRVALITGGGSGIGLEIAQQLALHGAKVVVMGRRVDPLKGAVASIEGKGGHAAYFSGDVRSSDSADAAVAFAATTFGGLDILVNSAAGNFLAAAEDLSLNAFKTVIDIDAVGVFNLSRAAFPQLRSSSFGARIINISALLHKPATRYQLHAAAAKAAIDSMTRSLALEWAEYGIRVNGVAPGPIAGTPGLLKLAGPDSTFSTQGLPLGRMGEKCEVAFAVVYLCCSAADYITGETLGVDGATNMWKPPLMPKEMVRSFARKVEKKSRATGLAAKSNL